MKAILLNLFLLINLICYSQNIRNYQALQSRLKQAHELFEKNNFIAAGTLFENISKQSPENSEIHSESTFYNALSILRTNVGRGKELLQNYVEKYPESLYSDKAWFELGKTDFESGQYPNMIEAFKKVKTEKLSKEDQIEIIYQHGYALFMQQEYGAAENEFFRIKDSGDKIAPYAQYYYGHIQYLKGANQEALDIFNKLKDHQAFSQIIPYYNCQIYYRLHRYSEVINMAVTLLPKANDEQRLSLLRLQANSYFQLDQYDKAIPILEKWLTDTKLQSRDEFYMLGYSYYTLERYNEAKNYLERSTTDNDQLSQSAWFHLAGCYIKLNEKQKAANAFEAAANMNYNPEIKKEALFNQSKIIYELSYTPGNDNIKAFDRFISQYPDSKQNENAYQQLTKIYMSTNNFKDALESIGKIQIKSESIENVWQHAAYHRGLELFKNMDYTNAINCFDLVNQHGSNNQLKTASIYWKAESFYRLEDYDKAIAGFSNFLSLNNRSIPEYELAQYSLAYSLFQKQQYESAITSFTQFIGTNNLKDKVKTGDAYNRIADSYYSMRNYNSALQYYEKAVQLNAFEPDYAMYQKAMCLGLIQDNNGKIKELENLLHVFPESEYAVSAIYEQGRTSERNGQTAKAVENYNKIITNFPESDYLPKALVQMGLISYNNSDFKQSLQYHKRVAENFPGSPEAESAMLGIRNSYMELNDINAYIAYSNQLNVKNISNSEQDSLLYQSAEKMVTTNDPGAKIALEQYLQQFPSGNFRVNAHYYLAESKYNTGEYSSALENYKVVISEKDHIFKELSLTRAGELEYNAKSWQNALSIYEQLDQITQNDWNKIRAKAGKMRCHFQLANYQACIEASQELLSLEKLPENTNWEANFKLAISHYKLGRNQQAIPLLIKLATDLGTQEGAEAKYLIANILNSEGKFDEAENEIMDFISKNTPHQYWLAKSFVLLADIYTNKNDIFQATHTLKSIIENYQIVDDGIIEEAKKRLVKFEKQ